MISIIIIIIIIIINIINFIIVTDPSAERTRRGAATWRHTI